MRDDTVSATTPHSTWLEHNLKSSDKINHSSDNESFLYYFMISWVENVVGQGRKWMRRSSIISNIWQHEIRGECEHKPSNEHLDIALTWGLYINLYWRLAPHKICELNVQISFPCRSRQGREEEVKIGNHSIRGIIASQICTRACIDSFYFVNDNWLPLLWRSSTRSRYIK